MRLSLRKASHCGLAPAGLLGLVSQWSYDGSFMTFDSLSDNRAVISCLFSCFFTVSPDDFLDDLEGACVMSRLVPVALLWS